MPTISDETVKVLLRNNGFYLGDPQIFPISRYWNPVYKNSSLHVAYSPQEVINLNIYPFVSNIEVLGMRN